MTHGKQKNLSFAGVIAKLELITKVGHVAHEINIFSWIGTSFFKQCRPLVADGCARVVTAHALK